MPETIVVKRTRRQRDPLRLVNERPDDFGMAVSLIHGRIGWSGVLRLSTVFGLQLHDVNASPNFCNSPERKSKYLLPSTSQTRVPADVGDVVFGYAVANANN